MNRLLVCVAALAALSAAQATQTFTGVISDDQCGGSAGHTRMRMGATDAKCTVACIDAHGAAYVLVVDKNEYRPSDQKTPEKFAGQRVRITGTLDPKTKTIKVGSIAAVKLQEKP